MRASTSSCWPYRTPQLTQPTARLARLGREYGAVPRHTLAVAEQPLPLRERLHTPTYLFHAITVYYFHMFHHGHKIYKHLYYSIPATVHSYINYIELTYICRVDYSSVIISVTRWFVGNEQFLTELFRCVCLPSEWTRISERDRLYLEFVRRRTASRTELTLCLLFRRAVYRPRLRGAGSILLTPVGVVTGGRQRL